MAGDTQIEFDLTVGKNNVGAALDELKSGAKSAYSSFSALNLQMAAVVGAITGAAYSVKKFVDAAIESEESVARLNVALKQTGIYSDATSKKFQNLASAIQETSVYSDDQVMALESMLQNLGQFTSEGLEKATKASIELASAFKMDLNTAAMLVGKAATGNIMAFQRMGIEIKKGKTDAETFANTLEALKRLSGSSATELDTLGGSFKYLSNQMGDASESIGFAISEILHLKEATLLAAKGVQGLNDKVKENPKQAAISGLGLAARLATHDITLLKDAYDFFKNDVEKNPIKAKIDTENAILKMPLGTQGIFDTGFTQKQSSTPLIGDIAKASAESTKLLLDTKARQEELFQKNEEERRKALNDYNTFSEQIKNLGKTQEEVNKQEYDSRVKALDEFFKKGVVKSEDYSAQRYAIEIDLQDKISKLETDRILESHKLQIETDKKAAEEKKKNQEELAKNLSTGGGFLLNAMSGASGANQALSSAAGMAADMFLPGIGSTVSALTSQLSQGPEATKAMVREFAAALPILIEGLIEAIPTLIEELSKQFPKVITAMADVFGDPNFWIDFIKNMTKAAMQSAFAVPKAFISAIPEFFDGFGKQILNSIVDGFSQALDMIVDVINPFDGGGDGLLGLGFLGLAHGGQVQTVPNGFPNDTFPAMLSSGELVVDRSTVERLNSFMDGNQNNESSVTDALLAQILNALSNPTSVNTQLTVNGKAFADIILELDRSGYRLTT